jgi:hypothetical protein
MAWALSSVVLWALRLLFGIYRLGHLRGQTLGHTLSHCGAIMKRAELELKFTGAALGWAADELEFSDREISQTLGVDRKTVHRWRNRESVPGPEQRKQVEKLSQLKWLLDNAFRTPDIGKRWLYRPASGLGGKTPAASLLEGKIDSVIGVLATHISGAYV